MKYLNNYLKSNHPSEIKKALYWATAFGIQSVVSLKPSEDLFPIISQHIEGKEDIDTIIDMVKQHYHEKHKQINDYNVHSEEEADKVSARIVRILMDSDFELSPRGFSSVHHKMFSKIYHHSGELRVKPLSKKEWVLNKATVIYPSSDMIEDYLDYLFASERNVNYSGLSTHHKLRHYCEFIAKLFMINAFQFANSRAAFVYSLKYLLQNGFEIKNDTFYREAWYFRNAIIRACYTNMHQGVYPTTEYMEMFLGNLLLNESNDLRNHRMVVKGE